ncbi:J domain-containing protein [Spiroplasma turonicum]|uniref:J domain-containing protein n=1 Tax=Spiroplasma turonicum TaxID=216946 RepID=A0A0K1P6F6_9MOLU|nr:J domain-containing protein [Spiroplasma turonicum]AKU79784.1 hypothetical protein STURON_00538 [Spiroplasma turonicum]ALX70802.1 hypothetical protein STURO_v1c05360 [Spiroplasma turonicum]
MTAYRIIRWLVFIVISSIGILSIIFLNNYHGTIEKVLKGIPQLYNFDLNTNSKNFNVNGTLFWIIMGIFLTGFFYILFFLSFIIDVIKANKKLMSLNFINLIFMLIFGIVIVYLNYKVMLFFGQFIDNQDINGNTEYNYDTYNFITLLINCFTGFYVVSMFLFIINILPYKKQLKFWLAITFRWNTASVNVNNIENTNNKNNKINKKLRINNYINKTNLEKVTTNFNRLIWSNEFNNEIILDTEEVEALIDKYKTYSDFKSLTTFTFRNKFSMNIADENFQIQLYPSFLKEIDRSFYHINLISKYSRRIFMAAYYKFAYYVAFALEHSLNIVYARITTQILTFDNLDTKILKLTSENLNNFVLKLYNVVRSFEASNFKDYQNSYTYFDIGKVFYNELTNQIAKIFEYSYNEIIRIQDEMYTGEYNDDVLKHKNDKVKTAFDYFGLAYNSTYEEFKSRYREIIKKTHPDSVRINSESLIKLTTMININKEILEEYFQTI